MGSVNKKMADTDNKRTRPIRKLLHSSEDANQLSLFAVSDKPLRDTFFKTVSSDANEDASEDEKDDL